MLALVEDIKQFIKLLECANSMIYSFRRQYFFTGWNYQKRMIGLLQNNLNVMVTYAGEEIIKQLDVAMFLEASEQGDEILIADLVEGKIIPVVENLVQTLEAEIRPENFDYYNNNIEALKRNGMGELVDIIKKAEPIKGNSYSVEYTSVGYMTIRVDDANGSYYLNGNNNPMKDAYSYVAGNIEDEYYRYTLLGAGLFFEAKAIVECRPDVELDVIEEDAYLLKLAMSYADIEDLIDTGSITIKQELYKDYVSDANLDDRKILVRKPSIKHMTDPDAREVISRYFMNIMSREEQRYFLERNYRNNVSSGDNIKSVDECRGLFERRRVYLVAGGPSLDLIVDELHNRPPNSSIMCVGTSAAKLMNQGIVPDMVIITDASDNMFRQIHDVLDVKKTKLLYLSTANDKAVRGFKGNKYLICQHGMPKAEKFADEHGYSLFETGGSVATAALDICLRFQCSEIVCMGLDLAYTNNKTHASDTLGERGLFDESQIYYDVKGVRGDSIKTSENLHAYHVWIEQRIENEQNVKMINISNGAFIHGMENRPI